MKPGQEAEHLRLLSLFHYVVAGILALFSMFPLIHLAVGIAIVSGEFNGKGGGPPAVFGWIFILIPLIIILGGLAISICIAIAGSRLRRYSSYTFCLVVAAVECMFMPIGTVLGVFTIIVLTQPATKELFGVATAEGSRSPEPPLT